MKDDSENIESMQVDSKSSDDESSSSLSKNSQGFEQHSLRYGSLR